MYSMCVPRGDEDIPSRRKGEIIFKVERDIIRVIKQHNPLFVNMCQPKKHVSDRFANPSRDRDSTKVDVDVLPRGRVDVEGDGEPGQVRQGNAIMNTRDVPRLDFKILPIAMSMYEFRRNLGLACAS